VKETDHKIIVFSHKIKIDLPQKRHFEKDFEFTLSIKALYSRLLENWLFTGDAARLAFGEFCAEKRTVKLIKLLYSCKSAYSSVLSRASDIYPLSVKIEERCWENQRFSIDQYIQYMHSLMSYPSLEVFFKFPTTNCIITKTSLRIAP
jgi:hypothetical protein